MDRANRFCFGAFAGVVAGLALPLVFLSLAAPADAQIAPGVTQSAAHTANISGKVTSSTGAPVAGATIRLTGPSIRSTGSAADGSFNFQSVPWGTYDITVTSSLGTAARGNVVLNGDVNLAIEYQAPSELRTIAHVSTTSAGAHINVTSTSILSVNPAEYAFDGNATWGRLFQQIPGVAATGYAGGEAAFAAAIPNAPQAPVVLSLNGALPYETATTLDGMPLQGTSAAEDLSYVGGGLDLSNLPVNAFDTADVVRGPGANAPSVLDSIGGSFVLHPPEQVNANYFEGSLSNDPFGGLISNFSLGLHLGRLSTTLIYGSNTSPGPIGKVTTFAAYESTPATINGEPVSGSISNYPPNGFGFSNCYCIYQNTLLYSGVPVSSDWAAHSGAASLLYNIGSTITAQVFYAGTTSVQNGAIDGYALVEFSPQASSPPYAGSLAPSPNGRPTYNFLIGLNAPDVTSSSLLEEKVTALLGEGVLRLAALQYNTFFNDSPYEQAPPNGTYTLWGTADVGGTTTAFNGVPAAVTFTSEAIPFSNSSHNRDLMGSFAIPVGSASSAGVSWVQSYYNDPYSETLFYAGTPVFSDALSPSVSATTDETRVHFDSHVSDTISLGLSWYLVGASYHLAPLGTSDYRNQTFRYDAPRFGAVWLATPNISIRAAAGGGYALPALYNLTGTPLTYDGFAYLESLPEPNLKPEESFGVDLGADLRLRRDTVLSVDLYRTNLYGQFFSSYTVSTYNGQRLIDTQFGNIGTSRMEGINVDVRHEPSSGYYWGGTLGFTRGYVVSVPPGFYNDPATPCTNCVNQAVVPGPNFTSVSFAATVPYASASAQLGYRWRPNTYFDLSPTYYGNNNGYDQPAFVALDAHAGYALTPSLSLLATFMNVTGIHDESIATQYPAYAVPVIAGAPPATPGVAFFLPYEPRTVLVTLRYGSPLQHGTP